LQIPSAGRQPEYTDRIARTHEKIMSPLLFI
jgi:hypothetical protein